MGNFHFDTLIAEPVQGMLHKITGLLPTLVVPLVVLILGWVLANLIRTGLERFFEMVKFEDFAHSIGLSKVFDKGDVDLTVSESITTVIYYSLIITVLVTGLHALGIGFSEHLIDGILGYIPTVLSALFALVVGLIMAGFISRIVRMIANNVRLPKPDLLENITSWTIIIFTFTVTLKELGLSFLFEGETFVTVFMAICFAFGLAFGLGGKDSASQFLDNVGK